MRNVQLRLSSSADRWQPFWPLIAGCSDGRLVGFELSEDSEECSAVTTVVVSTLIVVMNDLVLSAGDGLTFEDGRDRGRILVSSTSTDGAYSVMEWMVAAGVDGELLGFGAHRHERIEETFMIHSGALEFLIGDEVREVSAGDFVRVPAGVRHGYRNVSGAPWRW